METVADSNFSKAFWVKSGQSRCVDIVRHMRKFVRLKVLFIWKASGVGNSDYQGGEGWCPELDFTSIAISRRIIIIAVVKI